MTIGAVNNTLPTKDHKGTQVLPTADQLNPTDTGVPSQPATVEALFSQDETG